MRGKQTRRLVTPTMRINEPVGCRRRCCRRGGSCSSCPPELREWGRAEGTYYSDWRGGGRFRLLALYVTNSDEGCRSIPCGDDSVPPSGGDLVLPEGFAFTTANNHRAAGSPSRQRCPLGVSWQRESWPAPIRGCGSLLQGLNLSATASETCSQERASSVRSRFLR